MLASPEIILCSLGLLLTACLRLIYVNITRAKTSIATSDHDSNIILQLPALFPRAAHPTCLGKDGGRSWSLNIS